MPRRIYLEVFRYILPICLASSLSNAAPPVLTQAASSPELSSEYLLRRNARIAEFTTARAQDPEHGTWPQELKALTELEALLAQLVPTVHIAGFLNDGKINLETLTKGEYGYGMLDGIRHLGTDGNEKSASRFIVTTRTILGRYLKDARRLSTNINQALNSSALFSDGFYEDAIFTFMEPIPVTKSRQGVLAFANLGFLSQDDLLIPPHVLFVSFASGNFVVLVIRNLNKPIPEYSRCAKIRELSYKQDDIVRHNGRYDKKMNATLQIHYRKSLSDYSACEASYYHKSAEFHTAEMVAQQIVDELQHQLAKDSASN